MPFTFSHPAIILPLTKYSGRKFSLTGLIIGSMTPDFEYFFRMKIQSNFSHTIEELLYFDLPVGVLFAFVFHNIIRNSLYNNLPIFFSKRLKTFKAFNWNKYFNQHYFVVIISTLLGAASHLFWDSFTHIHGYSVQAFSIMQDTFDIAGNKIPVFKTLQHLSTLLGGLFLTVAFYRLPITNSTEHQIDMKYWVSILTISSGIIGLRVALGIDKNLSGSLIVTSISAILIAMMIAPDLVRQKL